MTGKVDVGARLHIQLAARLTIAVSRRAYRVLPFTVPTTGFVRARTGICFRFDEVCQRLCKRVEQFKKSKAGVSLRAYFAVISNFTQSV